MRNNVIIILGVGMLLLVIFGLTLVSQYTASTTEDPITQTEKSETVQGPPLIFTNSVVAFEPNADDDNYHKKYFQGFYELTDSLVKVNFWFKNPHKVPVTVTVRGRSCTSCTSANVAVVSPEAIKQFTTHAAMSRMAPSTLLVPDLMTSLSYLAMAEKFQWQTLDFEKPEVGAVIPPATDDNQPTWGIFQMVIKVSALGSQTRAVDLAAAVGKALPVQNKFYATLIGVQSFDISTVKIDIGDFPEGSAQRSYEILSWSATRDATGFTTPSVSVTPKDAFVQIGATVPLTDDEKKTIYLQRIATPNPTRVMSGYKTPITVYRTAPTDPANPKPAPLDIGPFERQVGFASTGTSVQSLAITANVTGIVSLVEKNIIDLDGFNGRIGIEKTVNIVSDRLDLDLKLVPEEILPKYLKTELSPPRLENGRRFWSLKVSIAPDACLDDIPPRSYIVLQTQSGGEPIKIRLPIKGRGFSRGR
jgi:hypothetical protein